MIEYLYIYFHLFIEQCILSLRNLLFVPCLGAMSGSHSIFVQYDLGHMPK